MKGAELYTDQGLLPADRTLERGYHRDSHHPIAPTEFPKDPSTAQGSDAGAPSQGAIWDPQEEDTFHRATPLKERMPAWAYPQISMDKGTHRAVIYRLHQSLPSQSRQVIRLHPRKAARGSPPLNFRSYPPDRLSLGDKSTSDRIA